MNMWPDPSVWLNGDSFNTEWVMAVVPLSSKEFFLAHSLYKYQIIFNKAGTRLLIIWSPCNEVIGEDLKLMCTGTREYLVMYTQLLHTMHWLICHQTRAPHYSVAWLTVNMRDWATSLSGIVATRGPWSMCSCADFLLYVVNLVVVHLLRPVCQLRACGWMVKVSLSGPKDRRFNSHWSHKNLYFILFF